MPSFAYHALKQNGKTQKGVLVADTPLLARRDLKAKGWHILKLSATENKDKISTGIFARKKLSMAELLLLSRQLSTLISAGLPMEVIFASLLKQHARPALTKALGDIQSSLREGHSLADAMASTGGMFPEYFVASIASGEQTGKLDIVTKNLADYIQSQASARSSTFNALIYPAFLFAFSLMVLMMLFIYVVPELAQVFNRSGYELPFITRALMSISTALQDYGVWMALAIVAALSGFYASLQNSHIRRTFHGFLLRLPVIGYFIHASQQAAFLRTFHIVRSSRVPMVQGLNLSARVVTNLVMRDDLERIAEHVEKGEPLSRAMEGSHFAPPLVLQLIANGEASGDLDRMLDHAALTIENDANNLKQRMTSLIEPLMLVFVGGIVIVMVLAVLLPIFDIQSFIGR